MTYSVHNIKGTRLEVFIPSRLIRIEHEGKTFKFYAHTQGEKDIVVYLGHGEISLQIKRAIKQWADENGIGEISWGRDREISACKKIA